MSESGGRGASSERFNTFLREEVRREDISDEEIRRRLIEQKREQRAQEERERRRYNSFGKKILACVVGLGVLVGSVFGGDAVEKGLRQSDFNHSMQNYTWAEHGSTTYPDDLSETQYAELEQKIMTNKTEDIYDAKKGEGAFDQLDESHQDALVGETYHYYGKDEDIPESVADADELDKEWAHGEIGADTLREKLSNWFDIKG